MCFFFNFFCPKLGHSSWGKFLENQKVGTSFFNFSGANFKKLKKLGQSCENCKSWGIRVGAKKKKFKKLEKKTPWVIKWKNKDFYVFGKCLSCQEKFSKISEFEISLSYASVFLSQT